MPYLPRVSHVSPEIPKMAIRGSFEAALRKGVTTALLVCKYYNKFMTHENYVVLNKTTGKTSSEYDFDRKHILY